MFIRTCFLSLMMVTLQAEFIEFDEFDEFEEFSTIQSQSDELTLEHPVDDMREESITQFPREEIIAAQENREALIDLVHSFSEKDYQVVKTDEGYFFIPPEKKLDYPSHLHQLLEPYLKKGGTVVDYGAGSGIWTVALSDLVGREGKVVAFEPYPRDFIEMFWNLVLNHVHNAELYCQLGDSLDALELRNVTLIRINADGKEDHFLKGAALTIQEQKPVLILRMLGGIPLAWADRFIRQEYDRRLLEIHKMGYFTQQISSGEFLAVPFSLQSFSAR